MNTPLADYELTEKIGSQTLSVLEQLQSKGSEFELPAPPAALEQYRAKLAANEYKMLVVGEAKRGKSTFINALIGQDLLPTDVDIATSQVFQISASEHEAYRLRFEDESTQDISRADLLKYGSQVVQDREEMPRPGEVLRWIEVEVPAQFLPAGVHILDTPGTGSLYAAHAQITNRFIPQADGVIFVLSSEKIIIQDEVSFIEAILKVTPNIFFIQTKIDDYTSWETTRQRNLEVLRERFGAQLSEINIYPVSSTNLREAAEPDAAQDILLMASRHAELMTALRNFLFRVAGWSRSAEAAILAQQYHAVGRKTLSLRLENLQEETRQKSEEAQQRAAQRKKEFEADWSEQGQRKRELGNELKKAITIGRRRMAEALQPGRETALALEAEIEAVETVAKANELGERLWERVVVAASDEWLYVCSQVHARCNELLVPLLEYSEAMALRAEDQAIDFTLMANPFHEIRDDWWPKFKTAKFDMFIAAGFGSLIALTPLAPIAIPLTLWGFWRGWKTAKESQVKGAKQELRKLLSDSLLRVRAHFFDVNVATGRLGLVDEYFADFEKAVIGQVQSLVKQKVAEVQAELTRLREAAKLDEEARQQEANKIQGQLAQWEAINADLTSVMMQLKKFQ